MRILVVYPRISFFGGAELVVVRFCNYLSSHGIANALLTTSITAEVQKELIDTELLCAPVTNDRLYTKFLALLQLFRKVQHRFDVINCHNFPAEVLSLFSRRPVVWLCNEPELYLIASSGGLYLARQIVFNLLLAAERWLVRNRITATVVADEGNSARFRQIYSVNPEIINYGIDSDFFSQRLVPDSLQFPSLSEKFLLLHAGTLTPYKNQLASLKVVNELRVEIPAIHLVLAGSGQGRYRESLEQFIHENDLASFVTFTGHVDRETMRSLYHIADILIHPVATQGGWLAPFEALSAGLPVIVSSELMAANIILENEIGVVTDDYVFSIRDFFYNREKYLIMAQVGKQWVQENLGWDQFCRKLFDVCAESVKFGSV